MGSPTDAAYTISLLQTELLPRADASAYVYANDSTALSYTPSATYRYVSSGVTPTIERTATGDYRVELVSTPLGGGNVMVTAYSSARHCGVRAWADTSVLVRCYDASGNLADSQFAMRFVR